MFAPWNCDQSTSGSCVNTELRSRTLRRLREFSLVLRRKYPVAGMISPMLTIPCLSANLSAAFPPPEQTIVKHERHLTLFGFTLNMNRKI